MNQLWVFCKQALNWIVNKHILYVRNWEIDETKLKYCELKSRRYLNIIIWFKGRRIDASSRRIVCFLNSIVRQQHWNPIATYANTYLETVNNDENNSATWKWKKANKTTSPPHHPLAHCHSNHAILPSLLTATVMRKLVQYEWPDENVLPNAVKSNFALREIVNWDIVPSN